MGDPLPSVPDRFTPPSLHDPLPRRKDAFEQFDPDQTIDPTNDGVSGLWFPDVNKMYILSRGCGTSYTCETTLLEPS